MKSFATSHMKHRRGSLPRDIQEACHRHSLVFGASTQETISALTLGVIGAGGTGSLLIEQLKRLYPKKLVFIDSDRVSVSNLNRLVGATCEDARKRSLKIDIASRGVQELDRRIQCEAINGDFLLELRQRRFLQCDFIFGATDSVAARLAANRLCLAHGIPYLDVGVGAEVKNGTLAASGGQVIKVLPDRGFCLQCAELFDLRIASIEFLDEKERKRQENVG